MFGESGDQQLRRSVLMGLISDLAVCADHIGVAAQAGVVTLSGYVTSHAQKDAANAAALRVKGVAKVMNRVGVGVPCYVHEPTINAENLELRSPLNLARRLSRASQSRTEEPADARPHHQL